MELKGLNVQILQTKLKPIFLQADEKHLVRMWKGNYNYADVCVYHCK